MLSCFLALILTILLRSKPKLKIPESLRSEASTSALTKSIMQDEDTADFTVSCETKTFKVHKNFLCSRLVLVQIFCFGSFNSVPPQVSCAPSHDPRPDEGGSQERGLH